MSSPSQFSLAELHRLAASGVHKIDLMGPRGTTLCTMQEIEAMACVIVLSGALPRLKASLHEPATEQETSDAVS